MWWALGVIGVLAAINAVLGWRQSARLDGWVDSWDWFDGDDSGVGLFDYFSGSGGDWSSD
jgi:hypothetical protein